MSKLRLSPASAEYVRFERFQLESGPSRNMRTTCEKPDKAVHGLSVVTSAPTSRSFPRPDGQDGTVGPSQGLKCLRNLNGIDI